MSFSGFGGGGFGQNNNTNNQTTAFGGFGQANNNTNTGSAFGSTNTGFGQNNNSGSLFGATNNNAASTTSGFGAGTGGFGSNNNNTFGAKTGFGATNTGGSLFGGAANNTTNTANTGTFGGFGSTNNNTSTGFGGGGGGLFGNNANKPAFGSTGTGSLFGGNNTTNTTSGFGASTGFGAGNTGVTENTGTANTAFQAFTEKEGTTNNTQSFQNILFQDPYKKWSADELRLADYAQGRRHGNPSGAGAFGVSSNFGGGFGSTQQTSGFGNTNTTNTTGGLFGANTNNTATNTSTGFGGTGTSAFGATNNNNASGGLFGNANKPAGGLFGSTNTTQPAATGFGTNTGTGFGGANSSFGGNNTTGGLFGGNTQANKPATGGLFGGATNTATNTFGTNTAGGFGATNTNTSGGLFGANNTANANQSTTGGLFGGNNNQQQNQQSGSLFGGGFGQQNNQQQQAGNSVFGNQAKPAGGLFGGSTAQPGSTGGLFGGANNQQQQNTSAFGATNNNAGGGGLFGGAKPGGLFGTATNQTANTGTGLFNNNAQTQQSGTTGLFGGANNQQQKPSLFGTSQNAGGSLFGGQNNQNAGSSLFGASANQQAQGLGNSMLNNSQQASNAPQGLTANLNDVSAYGSPSLFGSSINNEVANPGPLATPLNSSAKPKRGSILAMSKMAPASASRYGTPQKRAYGFSYSTYGTPGGSPASSIASTPGTLGRSLLGASSSGSLSKSMSTNNLRRNFNTDDSILAPGAFSSSSGPRWYGSTGSKKLVINRDIRSDLFSTPQKDKLIVDGNTSSRKLSKRVSFDTSNVEPDGETVIRGALPAPESSPIAQADETPRQNRHSNGINGARTPEADTNRSTDLKIVHEEDHSATPEANSVGGVDKAPGDYWSQPSYEELKNMNRIQRQSIDNFVIGRHNVGSIAFKFPVDITGIEVEELYGGIIQLEPRSATVYPVTAKKPPVGKGLNVPSKISLEQSWPRGSRDKVTTDPKRFKKHVDRLKRIPDTTFESYDKDSGVWVFSVEHFTTYGFDNSEDESDEEMATEEVPEQPSVTFRAQQFILNSSVTSSNADEAFEPRRSHGLPGAFDEQEIMDDGVAAPFQQSFLGNSSADSAPNDVRLSLDNEDLADMGEGYDLSDNEDVARSSVRQHHVAEHDGYSSQEDQEPLPVTPGGILRARMRAVKESAGPLELEIADGDDWMEMLRKTVSPVKRDRQLLKGLNESSPRRVGALVDPSFEADQDLRKSAAFRRTTTSRLAGLQAPTQLSMEKGRGFATSIDLMNSLFEKPNRTTTQNHRVSISAEKGFPKWPYERQPKSLEISDAEQAFHDASRPTWGPQETIVVTRKPKSLSTSRASFRSASSDILSLQRSTIQTENQTVQLGKFSLELSKKFLGAQDRLTEIRVEDEVPVASLRSPSVARVFHHEEMNDPASIHEKRVWELASILFDDLENDGTGQLAQSVRKSNLSRYWTTLVDAICSTSIGLAGSSEEKAVACLAGHRVSEACKHLLESKNFRLATLVSLIGTSDVAKKDMKEQIKGWHDSKMLSEFSEPIRAMYELLSGNVCVCEGLKAVPIEDRLDSFVISKKFGLDWKQAFGLRLWYAISQQEDLSVAVQQFLADIQQDKEALPQPWYREQGISPLWDDDKTSQRQDLLWGLLQLYADPKADLEAILRPENSQLSPLDMRLTWQLGVALVATGKVSFGSNGNQKSDAASVAYASQLTSAGEWVEAIFVLLHLSEPLARKKAVQEHLCRHAGLIDADLEGNFTLLTEKYQIPAPWIWEALALYNRSVKKDATAEVQCLLKAGSFSEAHRILSQQVAPLAIIERGYKHLSALLSQFDGRQEHISDWQLGGEVYSLFLTLVQYRNKGDGAPRSLLEQLTAGLFAMNEDAADGEIIRFAALSDMADETAKEILKSTRKKQDTEFRSKILRLPLTQDRLLAYSVDLGMERYREVMSH
ncbi:hypothetical protein V2G26_008862 [Clonostachys chloroleuca]